MAQCVWVCVASGIEQGGANPRRKTALSTDLMDRTLQSCFAPPEPPSLTQPSRHPLPYLSQVCR